MKKAFISGVTSGIGRATAEKFLKNGYRVRGCGRQDPEVISDLLKLGLEYVRLDIAKPSELIPFARNLQDIDILVNNAGLSLGLGHFDKNNSEDIQTVVQTNLIGLMELTRQAIPFMRAKGRGHIINVGSIAGEQTYENGALYCATKAGVHAFSEGLKKDLTGSGIRVGVVAPGKVETNFSNIRFKGDLEKAKKVYQGYRPLKPQDIAEIIFFMVSMPDHVEITHLTVLATDQVDATQIRPQTPLSR